jgi:two-component system sensor histidine kinase TctE
MNKSIRQQLLLWLLLPLICVSAINMVVCYPLARHLSEDAFDRQLLNSADSIATRIKVSPTGKVLVDLPPAAQAILRYNNNDKFYYQVVSGAGKSISGDAIPIPPLDLVTPSLRYERIGQRDVRVATISINDPNGNDRAWVQVAETLTSRAQLTEELLTAILAPQVVLLVLAGIAITFGIKRGLQPLRALQKQIASRSKFDLSPVPEHSAPQEVKPLVESINTLLKQLDNDIETQRRFVANAAHQLRTPLAGVKTYMGLASRNNADPKVSRMLLQADSGITRMTKLVNKLLALAKAEPNNVGRKEKQRIDLNGLVSEAAAELVSEAINKSIELVVEPSASRATVDGDPDALQEMMTNVIENAIRYTPQNGTVTIRINADAPHIVEVIDNGPGIPTSEREKIFERFYRIADSDIDGSGLGLSIVKEIALAHQISVEVADNSIESSGTVVRLKFPASRGNAAAV